LHRHRKKRELQTVLAMKLRRQHRVAGFTLIELMVTLTILGILLMIGVPSFVAIQRSSELTSTANSLVAALGAARGEAMKRGRSAVVVPKVGSDWTTGWTVFVDTNNDQVFNSTDVLVGQRSALASYLTATGQGTAQGSPGYIMFDPSGYTKTSAATFQSATLTIARNDLTGADVSQQTRIIVIAKTGRVRACKPATDATCTPTATE
jgi:type IV fimbrial biogenesis protein FimT